MNAQERTALALRSALDQELAEVRTTVEARDRLIRSAQDRTGQTWRSRRLRPVLALPVAGMLVTAVIAAAVVIPATLRREPVPVSLASNAGPSLSAPELSANPSAAPASSAVPEPLGTSRTALRQSEIGWKPILSASRIQAGTRLFLTLQGRSAGSGGISVQWGDRSPNSEQPGNCSRSAQPNEIDALAHIYEQAGEYTVTVILNECGNRSQQRVEVTVVSAAAPVDGR